MPALLDLSVDELLTTTRAVRKRLDLGRPVERSVIEECIDLALQAPTGSNQQAWHWIVVTEPATKQALAELYGRGFDPYAGSAADVASLPATADTRIARARQIRESAVYLRQHMHEVPVLVVPCTWTRPEALPPESQAGYWGAIFPAVWSFQLALRSRGLGSTLTTLHLAYEREAAEVLGIPFDHCAQAGLLPVAYTIGTDFRRGPRNPAHEVIHWERW